MNYIFSLFGEPNRKYEDLVETYTKEGNLHIVNNNTKLAAKSYYEVAENYSKFSLFEASNYIILKLVIYLKI